jgi:U3 small nucleolar RNA-associated protein 3
VSDANKVKKSVKFRDKKSKLAGVGVDEDTDNEAIQDGEAGEAEGSVKRPINYEIMKNKGLTPNRPKMYRNPRVRNRFKSRQANIKHKSIIPKVRTQDKRYTGEATGIRTGIVRAHKIK